MKRVLVVTLSIALLFAGCGNDSNQSNGSAGSGKYDDASEDEFAEALDKARLAEKNCRIFVRADKTVNEGPGSDAFIVHCFFANFTDVFLEDPLLTPLEVGLEAADKAIADQKKYGE